MKRWMRTTMAAACLAATSTMAEADTLAGLYAGVGIWRAGPDGNIGATAADVDTLGLSAQSNAFVYAAIEHGVPLLPNVKLKHSRLTSRGQGTLSRPFKLDDVEFSAGEVVSTDLDLTHTDAVLYYELLDTVVSLDVGLTLRLFNGHARVVGRNRTLSESVDVDLTIPAAYGRALIGLPAGFALGAEASAIGYSGNSITDISGHIAYSYDSLVDLGVEVGYRRLSLQVDDDADTNVGLGGPYAAVTLHF